MLHLGISVPGCFFVRTVVQQIKKILHIKYYCHQIIRKAIGMSKKLTTSKLDRQNILNNEKALDEI